MNGGPPSQHSSVLNLPALEFTDWAHVENRGLTIESGVLPSGVGPLPARQSVRTAEFLRRASVPASGGHRQNISCGGGGGGEKWVRKVARQTSQAMERNTAEAIILTKLDLKTAYKFRRNTRY